MIFMICIALSYADMHVISVTFWITVACEALSWSLKSFMHVSVFLSEFNRWRKSSEIRHFWWISYHLAWNTLFFSLKRNILNQLLNFLLHFCILSFHNFTVSNIWNFLGFYTAQLLIDTGLVLDININDFTWREINWSLSYRLSFHPLLLRYLASILPKFARLIFFVGGAFRQVFQTFFHLFFEAGFGLSIGIT